MSSPAMPLPPKGKTWRSSRLLPHALLFAVVLVWGTTFPLVKAALRDVSPLLFNYLRMTLAALLLLAVNAHALRGLRRRDLVSGVAAGVLLALGYQLQTAGLVRTTPSKSAFLTGLVVVIVPLLSMVPGVRVPGTPRPGLPAFTGALLALAGVVLLTSAPVSGLGPGPMLFSSLGVGEWLTVGCALAFAAHLLTVAHGAKATSARRLGTLQISAAALVMFLSLPLERHPFLRWTPAVLWALLITAVLATAAAFTIQSWAQERLPASHVALIFTLEPVFAWLTSFVLLGERLSPRALAGAALILCGILVVELGPTLRGATSFSRKSVTSFMGPLP